MDIQNSYWTISYSADKTYLFHDFNEQKLSPISCKVRQIPTNPKELFCAMRKEAFWQGFCPESYYALRSLIEKYRVL